MLRACTLCQFLSVAWLCVGCRGKVSTDALAPNDRRVRVDFGRDTVSAGAQSGSDKPATAESAAPLVTSPAAPLGPKDQAPATNRSAPPDPIASKTVGDFPDCPANAHRVTRRNHDGEMILSCARGEGTRLKLNGPSWRWADEYHLAEAESYQDGLKHGVVLQWQGQGLRHTEGEFVLGKRQGTWREFHPNGVLLDECHYQDGLKHGRAMRWYANGKLRTEGEFALGKRQGTWQEYHPNGVLAEEAHYERDQLQGLRHRFYASGRQSLEASYERGAATGTWTTYYDAPQVAFTVFMKGGREDGKITGFFPDGSSWPIDHRSCGCAAFENCLYAARLLDFDALPPVHCAHETPHAVPLDRWGPLLKAVRVAWPPGDSKSPKGCVEDVKITCAPDLDGDSEADVLTEISYRLHSPDCTFARKHEILQSRVLVALSPQAGSPGAWRSLGLVAYLVLDDPDAESPNPTSFAGFVRLPNGGIGLRICQSDDAQDCYRGGTSEELMVLIEGGFSTIGWHQIPE